MLTRQEREQVVLDLYNQGKTIRDIAKEVRMSFRDIGAVLKKEEKAEILAEVLVNEAANLYKKMVKELTNETMTKAVVDSSANLLPAMIYSNEQTQNAISYRHKTQVHHG
jgi:translation initiation factor 2 beta subunit (eIF-2beta)/eIF-5